MPPVVALLAGTAALYFIFRRPRTTTQLEVEPDLEGRVIIPAMSVTMGRSATAAAVTAQYLPRPAKYALLGLAAATLGGLLALLPRIPQPQRYHDFADKRAVDGLPNVLNVASNFAFILAGARGLDFLMNEANVGPGGAFLDEREKLPYFGMFMGSMLVGLGSGYYHLAPDNPRLALDRAPMALTFASFLAAVMNDRINPHTATLALPPLVSAGVGSVAYWRATERKNNGDLRPYIFLQGTASLLSTMMMWLFPSRHKLGQEQWKVLGLYGLAMAGDVLDKPIYFLNRIVSGHTLKHFIGAAAVEKQLQLLRLRQAPAVQTASTLVSNAEAAEAKPAPMPHPVPQPVM